LYRESRDFAALNVAVFPIHVFVDDSFQFVIFMFMLASKAKNLADFKKDKTLAVDYLAEQYKKVLIENLDDYEKNDTD